MVRPLETLHNALSLRQLDAFLSFVTSANFKTPSSEYLPNTPSNKAKASITASTNENNDEINAQQQSKYKRSIPPHTLGLTSQDSSKIHHMNMQFTYTTKNFISFYKLI